MFQRSVRRRIAARGPLIAASLIAALTIAALLLVFNVAGTDARSSDPIPVVVMDLAEPTPTPTPEPHIGETIADATQDDGDGEVPPFEPEFEVTDVPPPVVANTSIILNKRDCPADVDVTSMDVDYFADTCHSPLNGVPFGLYPSLGQFNTETAGGGWIEWHDLWLGGVTIAETLPFGYGEPVVFCRPDIGNTDWTRYQPIGGAIALIMDTPDIAYLCSWFNVPLPDIDGTLQVEGERKVVAAKRECPTDIDVTSTDQYYWWNTCNTIMEVEFRLNTESGELTHQTDNGWTTWENLQNGSVRLEETVPEGYGEPVVFCKVGGDFYDISNSARVDVIDAGVDLDLQEDDGTHICSWYNIPAAESETGSFKVVKYWCDGAVYATDACEVYMGSVQFLFSLAPNEGDGIIFDTAGDGWHQLDVSPGVWELIEVGAEWCAIESPNIDGDGYFNVYADEETVVNVFNCNGDLTEDDPGDDSGDDPGDDSGDDADDEFDLTTVTKLPNTGTGSALTQTSAASDTARFALLGMIAFTTAVVLGLTSAHAGSFYRRLASSRN